MSYITWSNWCWLAWGWSTYRHAFDVMIAWPLLVWMIITIVVAGELQEDYRHIPVGARRTLSFLIGGAVASVWPIAVGSLAGAFAVAFLGSTARDTVEWSWEIIRDTASWAIAEPIRKRRARKEFPTAKLVDR